MQSHHSIEAIEKVFQTQERPVLVSCEDYRDYVCKYRYTDRQFKELIAWAFLNQWGLSVPEAALISVKRDHVSDVALKEGARYNYFERPIFGSLYLPSANEINNLTYAQPDNRIDLLKIALFDLWLANEDRNHNNYNLLLVSQSNGKKMIHPIDHGLCFNSTSIGVGSLSVLTEDESLLSSNYCKTLYANSNVVARDCETVLDSFRKNVRLCKKTLPEILNFVPPPWRIDSQEVQSWMDENLFSEKWLSSTQNTFRQYVQLYLH
ncbi:HipA family kinase [Arundinibacter roseus]|uniref:HipA-like kinase domain-containing protein n=1 Tax=Arundinibacter roseus TaxID=2070510 RepID=A0A4R4KQE3_9BACT|nr:HipA family kinase [Arundinibacter roseus]TDB69142.1 hypothetical protein EZE20_02060 [Arundinibacter roseus]